MLKKRLLLADADAAALEEFQQALGASWQVAAVANGTAALAELEKKPCDVVVADLDLAEIDGTELLNRIQSTYPKTLRFVLAREADRERMVKQVLGEHQFLGKPLERASLKSAVERACALADLIPRNSIRELVSRIRTLPTIPSLYLKVQALLKNPDVTTDQVGEIIAKDMAMMTKLLRVINSASFALSRKITDPTEAVGILGFETVGSMVLAIKTLNDFDKVKPVYFSIDRLWRHSTEVARNAKQIVLMQTDDRAVAETAFTAGLMHDLGKVVLAANFDDQYKGVQSLAQKQQMPLCDVEREIFGASHGEIGAYLLGLWGMPIEVLEAAALHHNPSRCLTRDFTALTAVHVANALEHEMRPDTDGMIAATIDEAYLAEIGMLERLPVWREAILNRSAGKSENAPGVLKIVKPSAPVSSSVAASASPRAEKSAPSKASFLRDPWVYVSVGTAAVAALVIWLGSGSLVKMMVTPGVVKVSARSTALQSSPAADTSVPVTSQETAKSEVVTPVKPTSNAAPVIVKVAPVTKTAPKDMGIADMKLQGIFYSAQNPTAILNGKMVQVNDVIGEVRVVEIKNSSITLADKQQKRTLLLKPGQ